MDRPKYSFKLLYRFCIYGLAAATVWIVATIAFVYSGLISEGAYNWHIFVWALPVSCFALSFTSRGSKVPVFGFVVNSIFIWTFLAAIFLFFISKSFILWPVFLIGIPLQVMVVMMFLMKKKR